MKLTPEQQAMLNGEKGEVMAKVVKTLVMYGDTFGAERMVPISSKYGHTVISFGLKVMKPVYDLYQEIIDAGLVSGQKFTADPKPLDKHVPSNLIEDLVFKKFMYTEQDKYEEQLRELGITSDDDYTCTCYLDQVGNKPAEGEVLSWAESSAVVYANSVLGARCNRGSRRAAARIRAAARREPQGDLGGRGQMQQKARGAASRLCHRHEGHGGGTVRQGAG